MLGIILDFSGTLFRPILGLVCSLTRFLFGVGGFISNVGCDNFKFKFIRLAAQLCVSTYTLLAGLVICLRLVGRVCAVGGLWLVRRVGFVAVLLLLLDGLGGRGGQFCLAGLVPGLWLVGRVGCVGWVGLVRRVVVVAVQMLLVVGLGGRGGQLFVSGLVPGLGLVGRVGWLGWVGLVRRAGGVAVLNVVVTLSVLRGRRVQLSVLV